MTTAPPKRKLAILLGFLCLAVRVERAYGAAPTCPITDSAATAAGLFDEAVSSGKCGHATPTPIPSAPELTQQQEEANQESAETFTTAIAAVGNLLAPMTAVGFFELIKEFTDSNSPMIFNPEPSLGTGSDSGSETVDIAL